MSYSAGTGSVGIAKQTEQGTFVEPTDFMKVTSIDLNPEGDKIIPDPEIASGGNNDISAVYQGTYKIGGSIDSYVRPEAIGLLFYGALGDYTASGEVDTGAYLHNIIPIASGELPWMSLKKMISSSNQIFNYTDCKINGFTIDINASEPCTATFDVVGISDEIGDYQEATYETAPMLIATSTAVKMNGSEVSVKSASLEFTNNLDDADYRVGSRFLGDIVEKRREINLNMDVVLDTTSELYRKAFYGSATATEAGFDVYAESVDIELSSPTTIAATALPFKISLNITNAIFTAAPIPASGDDLVVVPLELKATKNTDENIMEVHIWNEKTTY
jgi:tail tube protein